MESFCRNLDLILPTIIEEKFEILMKGKILAINLIYLFEVIHHYELMFWETSEIHFVLKYNLDHSNFYSASGLGWTAALAMAKVKN